MKVFVSILSWVIFLGVIAGIIYAANVLEFSFPRFKAFPKMGGLWALFFGFSLAFMWVEVWRLGKKKPFSCLKCMSAWLTLFIAYLFHVDFWYLYLPAGLFIGAMFSAVKMRYL